MIVVALLAGALGVAGCAHELGGPAPAVESELDPHLVCNELDPMTTVTITGSGFSPMPVDTATGPARLLLPTVTLLRSADLAGAAGTGEPVPVPDESPDESQVHWYSQERMDVDITPGMSLEEGIYGVTVTNPNGNEVSFTDALAVVPPPELTGVTPEAICVDQGPATFTLQGTGFLDVDGALPTVTVRGGGEEHVYDADGLTGCATLPEPATETQTCTEMTVTIPEDDLEPGTYEVVVTNPPPANCFSSETVLLEVVPPPDLTGVMPNLLCTSGGSIGLQGVGFRDGASVLVEDQAAERVEVDPGGESATADFYPGLSVGTHDVTFRNADGCEDTLPQAVEVIQGPVIFWVDPPVVYDGISTQITIFGSGLSAAVYRVELVPAGGGEAVELEFVLDEARGRVQAVVPAGTPAGEYDVIVYDEVCPAILPGGLEVTDALGLTIDLVDPSFGWVERSSSVSIFGSGFVNTPRAYLNPATPTPETIASALGAVSFLDASRLTAVVPPGLPVGVYDVIVVNPTGEVGLLEDGFTVTETPPPVVDSVTPGEVDAGDSWTIDVSGSGFDDPTVSWVCRDRTGETETFAGTVTGWTESTVEATIDATSLSAGTVCVLRVTNAGGAYGEYSAVAVTNPSSNIQPFLPGTDMTTARRGLALVAGRATRSARFLYALGGDDGSEAGALATSESASVDVFGSLGAWFAQPNGLPGPLTLTAARTIGRFIYLVGGHDGAAATDGVWRAEILDPLDAPVLEDIGVEQGEGAGLGPGIWYYRVAAVFPADHPINPGGEGLPSDPLVINFPDDLTDTLIVTVYWSEVAGAESYRVYRSPEPGAATGAERLIAEVPATQTSFVDDLTAVPGERAPLPLGAHGTWTALAPLGTPRAGHGLVHVVDPADPAVHYLHAVGGVDGSGAPLATTEHLTIAVAGEIDQTPDASWTAEVELLSAGRHQMGVYAVDHAAAPRVPLGTTYVYALAGLTSALGAAPDAVDTSEVALLGAGGQLGPFLPLAGPARRAGFAHVAASNFLYVLGGGPTPTSSTMSGEICGADLPCSGDPADPPDVRNWNNEGAASLDPPRYLPGSILESAFIFVVGGTDGDAPLRSTAQTVW
jgi:hypothetical protein